MSLESIRTRVALVILAILIVVTYLAAGGRFGPDRHGRIEIEYGANSGELEGASVEIDGRVVGTLQATSGATRTAFAVERGDHQVRILRAGYSSRTRNVEVEGGRQVLLILDLMAAPGSEDSAPTEIGFQG